MNRQLLSRFSAGVAGFLVAALGLSGAALGADAAPVGVKVPAHQRGKTRLPVDRNEAKLELVPGVPVNTGGETRDLLRAMEHL